MRVIAGKYKSRRLKSLEGDQTRPTLDQVKESFFNRIGPYFDGETILDVFGGSGAIVIEFISRGCSKGTIIEKDKSAIKIIKENIERIVEPIHIIHDSYHRALKKIEGSFDYIYCDPPYQFSEKDKLFELLEPIIKSETLLFYEADLKEEIVIPDYLELIRDDHYRRTKILWLQRAQSQTSDDPLLDLVEN